MTIAIKIIDTRKIEYRTWNVTLNIYQPETTYLEILRRRKTHLSQILQ